MLHIEKNDHSSSTIWKKNVKNVSRYLQNYIHRKKSKTGHKKHSVYLTASVRPVIPVLCLFGN